MFRIESPYYFILLLGVMILYFIFQYLQRNAQKYWNKLGNSIVLEKSFSFDRKSNKMQKSFFLLSLTFAILTLVNPQFGEKKMKVKSESAEIIIALDVSLSMLADDIKPSRLARAKIWIKQFTDKFPSEKIGLISFAGNAYLQSPLTNDIATINLMASIANPELAGTQGTSISNVLDLAIKSFPSKTGQHKLLLLLTDGEDQEGEVLEKAIEAANQGITIICIPFGTEEGSLIPITTPNGSDYKRDKEGNPVRTKPNLELLKDICSKNGGSVLDLNQGNELFDKLKDKMKSMMKKDASIQSFNEFESYYQWPLFCTIISLLISIYFHEKSKIRS